MTTRSFSVASLRGFGRYCDRRAGHLGDHLGEVADPVGLRHLVEDLHPLAALRRVLDGELDAAAVSWMWMKARVCPPVPCTVSG